MKILSHASVQMAAIVKTETFAMDLIAAISELAFTYLLLAHWDLATRTTVLVTKHSQNCNYDKKECSYLSQDIGWRQHQSDNIYYLLVVWECQ